MMATPPASPKACHNCRRQRWKCDKTLPKCQKCVKRGQECLGYQRLLRWERGIASRGKMAGMTFEAPTNSHVRHVDANPRIFGYPGELCTNGYFRSHESQIDGTLTDPLLQDLDHASRKYLFYFATDVCKDLVLYDIPKQNPFRELIPMIHQHPLLHHIIVANSALHMSNACEKPLILHNTSFPSSCRTNTPNWSCSSSPSLQKSESYSCALAAKQRALGLLRSALGNPTSMNVDAILAAVLLFVEFELLDSGRDHWRHHINGARTIIEKFCHPSMLTPASMTPLRCFLVSNCLVFDILGSTLTCPNDGISSTTSARALSLLQDAEGNHCSSLPAVLLQLLQSGAQLSHAGDLLSPSYSTTDSMQQLFGLIHNAQSFDPLAWAVKLGPCSPAPDLVSRTNVASAHRAAVCIYLSRVASSLDHTVQLPLNLEHLVAEIISNISTINTNDALFTATPWPAFIAGAETGEPTKQEWLARHFQELWKVEPWGLIRGALGVLDRIWEKRRKIRETAVPRDQAKRTEKDNNWVGDLRESGVDWLII